MRNDGDTMVPEAIDGVLRAQHFYGALGSESHIAKAK